MRARRRKNFIHSLREDSSEIFDHAGKERILHDHFTKFVDKQDDWQTTLNWERLAIPTIDPQGLDSPFSMAEVWAAIISSPTDKAPGPDGFTGQFYRSCWHIIQEDVMAVFDKFHQLAGQNFAEINTAVITLLPKKNGASEDNYSTISAWIHEFNGPTD